NRSNMIFVNVVNAPIARALWIIYVIVSVITTNELVLRFGTMYPGSESVELEMSSNMSRQPAMSCIRERAMPGSRRSLSIIVGLRFNLCAIEMSALVRRPRFRKED
ncbi:MAG: hypothetical protein ACYC8V_11740, partial [Caulobacteraceae bacterium]